MGREDSTEAVVDLGVASHSFGGPRSVARSAKPESASKTGTTGPGTPAQPLEFDEWYRLVHSRLVAAMYLSCGELDQAADVADEATARALERWDRVGVMRSPEGWTFQVAYNLLRRHGRRRAIERKALRRAYPRVDEPTVPAPAGEAWDAVRQLPRRQREVIVLRFIADLPEAEIGEVLGISRGTVSSSLAAAKSTLAEWLAVPGDRGPRASAAHQTPTEPHGAREKAESDPAITDLEELR